jgi:hypothetical protein
MKTENKSELLKEFQQLFLLAKRNGICKNQTQLAKYLDKVPATISGALKGESNLTDSLVSELRQRLIADGYIGNVKTGNITDSPNSNTGQSGISAEKHAQIISGILSEMAAQRESYERLLTLAISGKTDK